MQKIKSCPDICEIYVFTCKNIYQNIFKKH